MVEVSGRRVGDVPRLGEILDLLGEPGHEHYRVRWEDDHESILYPGEATTIRPRRPRSTPRLELGAATHGLVEMLHDARTEFELIPHRRTATATAEARVLGLLPQEVAKTVIARAPNGTHVRAVVAASRRVDIPRLAAAVSAPELTVLSEGDLVSAYPQFELGAVPPFGGPGGDIVVLDREIADAGHVVFDAGVHETALRMRGADLVDVAGAVVSTIAE